MKHKLAIGVAAVAIASTAFAPAAMAYEIHDSEGHVAAIPDNAPVVDDIAIDPDFFFPAADANGVLIPAPAEDVTPAEDATPAAPAKKDPKEQAELTGLQLDNAKKGVDTAKGIIDALAGIGRLLGLTD